MQIKLQGGFIFMDWIPVYRILCCFFIDLSLCKLSLSDLRGIHIKNIYNKSPHFASLYSSFFFSLYYYYHHILCLEYYSSTRATLFARFQEHGASPKSFSQYVLNSTNPLGNFLILLQLCGICVSFFTHQQSFL